MFYFLFALSPGLLDEAFVHHGMSALCVLYVLLHTFMRVISSCLLLLGFES